MNDMPRAIRMAYEYLNGRTMNEIGEQFGVSRERVRQVTAAFGLTGADGGKAIQMFASGKYRKKDPMSRVLHALGCTKGEAMQINNGLSLGDKTSPAWKFRRQKANAAMRGIEWNFTLPEWWSVWVESGKWEQMGRGSGYCMSRIGDTGGYSKDNVEIKTCSENIKESYFKTTAFERSIKRGYNPDHCKNGHARTPENFYSGGACKLCAREYSRKRYHAVVKPIKEAA